mgnify:CR=1 FL=1
MSVRVVITGLGVVAPNGVGLEEFTKAIKAGTSGVTFHQHIKDKGFSCCIGGVPSISQEKTHQYLSSLQLRGFNSTSILYGCIAGIDAWKDAGFSVEEQSNLDYDTGIIFGTGTSGIEKFREAIYKIDDQKVRRLGSTTVVQTMASGISIALVTTWLGLMVAIPTTFMYATVNNISKGILGTIEESSTGMAAKRSEKEA